MNEPLAIVDVETTGTSAAYHRVIEVAVLRVEAGRVVRRYQSLVNPERFVSPVITGITGITNDDVAGAPRFAEIARELQGLLRGAVFVAHNARFDQAFLRAEFARVGVRFAPRVLCTVKLSRALYPGERHHDLETVIHRHGIACAERHRAMGDAAAVYDFLQIARRDRGLERFGEAVRRILRSRTLPPRLDPDAVDDLPDGPGVYLLHGVRGELLYVGRSRSIRERVLEHFSAERELDMVQQIARVEARPTAGELGAMLLELHLIKEMHPIYNRVSRSKKPMVVARRSADRAGYARLTLEDGLDLAPDNAESVVAVFRNRSQAMQWLLATAREHELCHKLLGLEAPRSHCFAYQLKRCRGACGGDEPPEHYNARFEGAFARRRVTPWPFRGSVLVAEGDAAGGGGDVFLVDRWCLLSSARVGEFGLRPLVPGSFSFDYDCYRVLAKYLRDRRNRARIRAATEEDRRQLEEVA